MSDDLELLPAGDHAEQLMILLHDDGQDAAALLPLARAFRREFVHAALLLPQAFDAREGGDGHALPRRWFEPREGDEVAARAAVDTAVAHLQRWVREAQQRLQAAPSATALVGFGQGATLALELASADDGIAGRVLAFGGSYATLPARAPQMTTLHFFHGGADPVVPAVRAQRALEHLHVLQGDATLDVARGVGHELHPALIDCALHRLTHHIPHRTWRAALGALPPSALPQDPDD